MANFEHRNETAKKMADDLLEFVNDFGHDQRTFAEAITHGHKTLQQSFMRLMVRTFREMSKETPDERNEASVELAKKFCEVAEGYSLPFI